MFDGLEINRKGRPFWGRLVRTLLVFGTLLALGKLTEMTFSDENREALLEAGKEMSSAIYRLRPTQLAESYWEFLTASPSNFTSIDAFKLREKDYSRRLSACIDLEEPKPAPPPHSKGAPASKRPSGATNFDAAWAHCQATLGPSPKQTDLEVADSTIRSIGGFWQLRPVVALYAVIVAPIADGGGVSLIAILAQVLAGAAIAHRALRSVQLGRGVLIIYPITTVLVGSAIGIPLIYVVQWGVLPFFGAIIGIVWVCLPRAIDMAAHSFTEKWVERLPIRWGRRL